MPTRSPAVASQTKWASKIRIDIQLIMCCRMGPTRSSQSASMETRLERRRALSRRPSPLPPTQACRSHLRRRHRSWTLPAARQLRQKNVMEQHQSPSRLVSGESSAFSAVSAPQFMPQPRAMAVVVDEHPGHGCACCRRPDSTAGSESATFSTVREAGERTASSSLDQGASGMPWLPAPSQPNGPSDNSEGDWTSQARGSRQTSRQRRRQQAAAAAEQPASHDAAQSQLQSQPQPQLQSQPQPQLQSQPQPAQPTRSRSRTPASTAFSRVLTIRRPVSTGRAGSGGHIPEPVLPQASRPGAASSQPSRAGDDVRQPGNGMVRRSARGRCAQSYSSAGGVMLKL